MSIYLLYTNHISEGRVQKVLLGLLVALLAGSVQADPQKHPTATAVRSAESPANTALFRMFAAELSAKRDAFSDGPSFDEFKGQGFDLSLPVGPYDLENLGQPFWEYDKYSNKIAVTAFNGVNVKRTVSRGESYVGSNNFGVRAKVTNYRETVFEIATGSETEPAGKAIVDFEQQMTGEEARSFVNGLKLHLVGVIKSGSACDRGVGSFPTIDDPRHITRTNCRVYVRFTRVALTRSGQEIWVSGRNSQAPQDGGALMSVKAITIPEWRRLLKDVPIDNDSVARLATAYLKKSTALLNSGERAAGLRNTMIGLLLAQYVDERKSGDGELVSSRAIEAITESEAALVDAGVDLDTLKLSAENLRLSLKEQAGVLVSAGS